MVLGKCDMGNGFRPSPGRPVSRRSTVVAVGREGKTNKIASALDLSDKTVKKYLAEHFFPNWELVDGRRPRHLYARALPIRSMSSGHCYCDGEGLHAVILIVDDNQQICPLWLRATSGGGRGHRGTRGCGRQGRRQGDHRT